MAGQAGKLNVTLAGQDQLDGTAAPGQARQFLGQRTGGFQTQVPPAVRDSVAFVFLRDVEAANNGQVVVAYQDFAMVPVTQPIQFDRVKPMKFSTGFNQWVPKTLGQSQ